MKSEPGKINEDLPALSFNPLLLLLIKSSSNSNKVFFLGTLVKRGDSGTTERQLPLINSSAGGLI
jgi:hypothetical protein